MFINRNDGCRKWDRKINQNFICCGLVQYNHPGFASIPSLYLPHTPTLTYQEFGFARYPHPVLPLLPNQRLRKCRGNS